MSGVVAASTRSCGTGIIVIFEDCSSGKPGEEAACLAEPASLRWRCGTNITRLELATGAICIEIQNTFAWQRAMAGAILPILLAGCKHHVVELTFDRAFQFALWRLAE